MAWPMAMRAVMMFSIVIIDLYLVSSLGEEAVASIGIATVITGMVMGATLAFANAMQIKVAQAFGTQRSLELKTAFFCGLIINVAIVMVGIVFIVVFGTTLLDLMAHSSSVAKDAAGYLSVFILVMFTEAISSALTSHFNGCGRTKLAFYSFLLSAPANVVSSIVLIFGWYGFPELGLVGAAWGSLFGASLRLFFLAYQFYQTYQLMKKQNGWLHGNLGTAVLKQFKFSWPIAATFVSMTFAAQVCTAIYANMNIYHFAAMTLITPWVRIAGQLSYTWTQATGLLLAQMLGKSVPADLLDEFLSRAWRMAFVAAGLVAFIYALIVFAAGWIYADLNAQTRTALFSFLPVLLLIPFPRVSNSICGNVLRAAGDSRSSLNIHLFANWLVMVPLTAICVLVLELPVAWIFALFLLEELVKFPLFHRRIWEKEWHVLKVDT